MMASASQSKETTYLLGTPTRSDHNFKYGEALMHLVKGYVGTGIFSMGDAMKNAGLIFGPISVLLIGMICLHCCHLLVNSAHKLHKHYKLERVPDYSDTAKLCFTLGAPNFPAWAFVAKLTVNTFLIMAQVAFCCCYLVFISWNIRELLKAYKLSMDIRCIIAIVAIPIWLTCLIRTLKCLANLSIVANFLLLMSIIMVLYYAFSKPASECPVGLMIPGISKFAIFFGQSIFAFEGIGLEFVEVVISNNFDAVAITETWIKDCVSSDGASIDGYKLFRCDRSVGRGGSVLILYNEMSEPEQFSETYGVLNIGLHIVTVAYIFFGAITYLQFGNDIKETVTLNLDTTERLGQLVLVLISVGVSFSFSLQLYVAIDIIWPKIVLWLGPFKYPVMVELWFRTALVITICVMAEAIPRLEILLSFVGSFLSVALIVIFPAIIDIVTVYSFQKITTFILIKDFLIIFFGIVATIAGTYESIALLAQEL